MLNVALKQLTGPTYKLPVKSETWQVRKTNLR